MVSYYSFTTSLAQRVKHSKLADGIEQAMSDTKYLPSGVDADSVSAYCSFSLISSLPPSLPPSLSPSLPPSLPPLPPSPPSQLEICYSPIIQSGGQYMLKFSTISSDERLHFGTIVCCLGVRYKSYCSNIVRTMFVEPTKVREREGSEDGGICDDFQFHDDRRCRIIIRFFCLCTRKCWIL